MFQINIIKTTSPLSKTTKLMDDSLMSYKVSFYESVETKLKIGIKMVILYRPVQVTWHHLSSIGKYFFYLLESLLILSVMYNVTFSCWSTLELAYIIIIIYITLLCQCVISTFKYCSYPSYTSYLFWR